MVAVAKLCAALDELLSSTAAEHLKWSRFLELLHHLSAAQFDEGFERCSPARMKALDTLRTLTNQKSLLGIWNGLLNGPSSRSTDCMDFVNAYRLYANIFQHELPEWAVPEKLSRGLMDALLFHIADAGASLNGEVLSTMLSSIPSITMHQLAAALVSCDRQHLESNLASKLAQLVEPMVSIEITKTIFKLATKLVREEPQGSWTVTLQSTAQTLIRSALTKGITATEVCRSLVLEANYKGVPEAFTPRLSKVLADTVVGAVSSNTMVEVFATIGGVWGDKTFVTRVDSWKQAYLTQVLLAALALSDRACLYKPLHGGVTTDLLLSVGISHYLEVSSISIRKHGMRVAQAYATLIGETLDFPELRAVAAEEAAEESRRITSSTTASSATAKKVQPTVPVVGGSSPRHTTTTTAAGYDSDSDSSSIELQGYAIDEDVGQQQGGAVRPVYDYRDKMLRTNYLRDCLQMLRCPEGKPEARQQLHAALERIPVIMASDPPDAADLCQPLMKELLTVSNAYSIENFDTLRGAAVQCVLLRHPHIAVPFLTASLLGNDLPLGLKLLVLEWLMDAARALSNIPEDSPAPASALEQGGRPTDKGNPARAGKTVVKRPGKLAQLNSRTKYFRNNFGLLSALFFYPLIQLLGRIWHDKLNVEWAPTAAADQFNLISELFEPRDSDRAGGGAKGTTAATKDLTLKHLDGVDALLPSQCLVALGLFTRCTVNTTSQRDHALEVAKVASAFRLAEAVALRRAALYALRLSMEAYITASCNAASMAGAGAGVSAHGEPATATGPLEVLRSLSQANLREELGDHPEAAAEAAVMSVMAQPALVEVVDWAATTWKEDADEVARALKHEIVEMAVNGVTRFDMA